MQRFLFKSLLKDARTKARAGRIVTPHGVIETPAFVPVGTQATVKSLTPEELNTLGVQLFFVNTYHTYLRPGIEVIQKFGGLHKFMHWNGPLITDSGGFQVFSLGSKKFGRLRAAEVANENFGSSPVSFAEKAKSATSGLSRSQSGADQNFVGSPQLVKINDEGVDFCSHWDGTRHFFTPEKSIEIQHVLGADLLIAFDECAPYPTTHAHAKKAMERTHRWAARSLSKHQALSTKHPAQALYGVIQGSVYEDLRKESAEYISSMNFEGMAIGGVSVGESKEEMAKVLEWVVPLLPEDKPRHLLGVGEIDDIFTLVEWGIDTFDCVQPTRLGRMGKLLVRNKQIYQSDKSINEKHEIDIMKKLYAKDSKPVELGCTCYTCQNFSRAYLHHLFRVRELLAYRLATIHNIHFVNNLMRQIRRAIVRGKLLELKKKWLYNRT